MSENRVSKWGKVLVALILLPAAILVPVLSLESHYAPITQAQIKPDDAQAARVKKYKAALGREVAESDQTEIKLRCSVAQANAKTLASRLSSVQVKRNLAYNQILKNLNTLLGKLDNQAFETTALKENVATLDGKVDSFKKNMNDYYFATLDTATVNCSDDPLAFIASLQAARKAHEAVLPELTDIRAHVTNTVKPSLMQVRAQIESGQTTGGSQ